MDELKVKGSFHEKIPHAGTLVSGRETQKNENWLALESSDLRPLMRDRGHTPPASIASALVRKPEKGR